jgi:hypothetical protein
MKASELMIWFYQSLHIVDKNKTLSAIRKLSFAPETFFIHLKDGASAMAFSQRWRSFREKKSAESSLG